jgi:hypothetical protein
MTTTASDTLADRLEQIDIATVPVHALQRSAPRTVQAAAARSLFRSLGLRGISVTAPRYSMAHSVDVRIPRESDAHDQDRWPHDHSACCPDGEHTEENRCRVCARESWVRQRIEAILDLAFPNHRDRSDSQSDHFDFCWSID